MADKIRISPNELIEQATKLSNAAESIINSREKFNAIMATFREALSANMMADIDKKGNAVFKKLDNIYNDLNQASSLAKRSAETFQNMDSLLRNEVDGYQDKFKDSPVSEQRVVLPSSRPIDDISNITSSYGPRNLYGDFHYGTDFGVPEGTEVKAVVSGKIIASYYQQAGGNCIYLLGDDGYVYEYAHLSVRNYNNGDRIEVGQVIAKSGKTGEYVTGAHLHFGVYDANQALKDKNNIGQNNIAWKRKEDGSWYIPGSVDPINHLSEKYGL